MRWHVTQAWAHIHRLMCMCSSGCTPCVRASSCSSSPQSDRLMWLLTCMRCIPVTSCLASVLPCPAKGKVPRWHANSSPSFLCLLSQVFDIVGPVCESADFLGKDRKLPTPSEWGRTSNGYAFCLLHLLSCLSEMGTLRCTS